MNEKTSLQFLGDVIPYKPFRFRNTLKTIINLECPVTRDSKPVTGKVNLSVSENHLPEIFGDNILAVSLGNNHIMDYGPDGLNNTISHLEKVGIKYFGVNIPGNNNYNPLIIEFNGIRMAMMSVISESTSPTVEFDDFNYLTILESDEFSRTVSKIRGEVHRLIIYLHWGMAESSYPGREEVLAARRLIDAGADVIIGSHSHAPQPIEKYKEGIIAYNLGNFIMPEFRNTPSFYDETGNALSSLKKKLMLWNRISWGLVVDMESMEYRIRKFAFAANRIFEFRSTFLDRYLQLHPFIMDDKYNDLIKKHLNRRKFRRKVSETIW